MITARWLVRQWITTVKMDVGGEREPDGPVNWGEERGAGKACLAGPAVEIE
jgi:hypothetical protein